MFRAAPHSPLHIGRGSRKSRPSSLDLKFSARATPHENCTQFRRLFREAGTALRVCVGCSGFLRTYPHQQAEIEFDLRFVLNQGIGASWAASNDYVIEPQPALQTERERQDSA